MKIYLIRHGRQASKLCNVDVPLAEEGISQARLLGKRLEGENIDILYSSDYLRAVQTAEEANRFWKVRHVIRPELREISFGEMEGLGDEEIAVRFEEFKKEQEKMEADLPYPGGESASDVVRRVLPFLEELKKTDIKKAAIVCHGEVIRSLTAWFLGMDMAKWRLLGTSLENCSITELSYDRKRNRFTLERFNDYSHLEGFPELLRKNWK